MPDEPASGSRAEGEPQAGSSPEGAGAMPVPTFTTFVLSLASSGLVQLGEVPDPGSGRTETNLVLAKQTIDLLSMLREKTSSGLDEEESRLLDGLLYELRMKFVLKK
jgi:hypothetical protein